MAFEFEKSELWQLALQYVDTIYEVAGVLPSDEDQNLKAELKRSGAAVAVNVFRVTVAEGDQERARAASAALRFLLETVALVQIIQRRRFITAQSILEMVQQQAEALEQRLQAIRQQPAAKQIEAKQRKYLGVAKE